MSDDLKNPGRREFLKAGAVAGAGAALAGLGLADPSSAPGKGEARAQFKTAPIETVRVGQEPGGIDDECAGEENPETERVHARKRHVARPDHEGHHEIEKRRAHGHHRQENHGGAVHGEHLVVHVGAEDVVVRHHQLGADQHGLKPADQQEEQGGSSVEDTDPLVINGGQPAEKTGLGSRAFEERDGSRLGVGLGLVGI